MAAYAPLFCKKGYNKWNSNLIWFDNRGMWRTSNYYYQKLFSKAGDRAFLMSDVMNGNVADTTVYTSPTINTSTGEIYIKFVNSEAANKRVTRYLCEEPERPKLLFQPSGLQQRSHGECVSGKERKAGNEGNGMALCKKSVIYRSDSSAYCGPRHSEKEIRIHHA